MVVDETAIVGLRSIHFKSVTDERGTVGEFFRMSAFREAGLPAPATWAQINMTWTNRGGIRGLHGESMTKLVGVAAGTAYGAYLDARPDSPTHGTVVTAQLSAGVQMLVPPGVCNGFQATSDPGCQYFYCFDQEWMPGMPGVGVNPLDPELGIAWPIPPTPDDPSMMSAKDASAPRFSEL